MTPDERALDLLAQGYVQVSNGRQRLLARLPEGRTGRQALAELDHGYAVDRMTEAEAADTFLRLYAASDPQYSVQLDPATFAAFRRFGGGPIDAPPPRPRPPSRRRRAPWWVG